MKGTLYMIPVTLGDAVYDATIASGVLSVTRSLRLFAVEEIRTARRYLRLIDKTFPIDDSLFFEIGKHSSLAGLQPFFEKILSGSDAGVMSEAGMPGIADPGALVAREAHKKRIKVVPLTGPSSIMLGLSASGLNGQSFAFNGYLPVNPAERSKALKELEKRSSGGQTQIFIETPFRNEKMMEEILAVCKPSTIVCIACDITMPQESISTKSVDEWKRDKPQLAGKQVVFFIGNY